MSLSRTIAVLCITLAILVVSLTFAIMTGTAAGARAMPTPTVATAVPTSPGASPTPSPVATVTAAPSMTRTPTSVSTVAPTLTPLPTNTATPALTPVGDKKLLTGMSYVGQTWNNCGPASLSMVLSYYGVKKTQEEIGRSMHPDPAGKHVGTPELVNYLAAQGLSARVIVSGTVEVLQRLVANGVPVLVSGWIRGNEDIGHYRVAKGYDRSAGVLIFNDSYWGADYRLTAAQLDAVWWPFNRVYLPVYRPAQEPLVRAIIGDDWDPRFLMPRARSAAERETVAHPKDPYAWFNLGDDNLALGDFVSAVKAYERALALDLPSRILWYRTEPLIAYNKAGQFQRALDLSAPVLSRTTGVAQIYEQRGFAYLGLGKPDQAASEFKLAIFYDPGLTASKEALANLTPRSP